VNVIKRSVKFFSNLFSSRGKVAAQPVAASPKRSPIPLAARTQPKRQVKAERKVRTKTGARESARRIKQMASGILTRSNMGVTLTKGEREVMA